MENASDILDKATKERRNSIKNTDVALYHMQLAKKPTSWRHQLMSK